MPIRLMMKEDKTNVLALDAKIFAGKELWESSDFEMFFTENYSFKFDDPKTERLVGYIVVYKVTDSWFLIVNLGVDEAFRRQGIGFCLMKTVIDNINRLVTNDTWTIGLEVESTNEDAKKLYKKLGFELRFDGSSQVMSLTKDTFLEMQQLLEKVDEQMSVSGNKLHVTEDMGSMDISKVCQNEELTTPRDLSARSSNVASLLDPAIKLQEVESSGLQNNQAILEPAVVAQSIEQENTQQRLFTQRQCNLSQLECSDVIPHSTVLMCEPDMKSVSVSDNEGDIIFEELPSADEFVDVPIISSPIPARELLEREILLLEQKNYPGDKLEKFICLARQVNQSTMTLDNERMKIHEHVKQVQDYLVSPTADAAVILTKQANQAKGAPSVVFQALGYLMAAIAVVAACFQAYPLVGVAASLSAFGFYAGRRKGISAEMMNVKIEQLNQRLSARDTLPPIDRLLEDYESPRLPSPNTIAVQF